MRLWWIRHVGLASKCLNSSVKSMKISPSLADARSAASLRTVRLDLCAPRINVGNSLPPPTSPWRRRFATGSSLGTPKLGNGNPRIIRFVWWPLCGSSSSLNAANLFALSTVGCVPSISSGMRRIWIRHGHVKLVDHCPNSSFASCLSNRPRNANKSVPKRRVCHHPSNTNASRKQWCITE